ncbi:hypothetical protein CBW24_08045 [Pacificitalea manganoxidans]|uniref:Phage tail assembly protein n=2 Tax=Pacificitalea manganoxidans TaxID=1411902 RepID=A0A291LZ34_9RHOB|nr:hypothetical protein CBW24_08045 [Pacificitalea manganoxidans]
MDMTKTIELERGVEIAGARVMTLTMREPTVDDQIIAGETKGGSALQEVTLLANLCEVAPADIRRLAMRDYVKLQKAYAAFL